MSEGHNSGRIGMPQESNAPSGSEIRNNDCGSSNGGTTPAASTHTSAGSETESIVETIDWLRLRSHRYVQFSRALLGEIDATATSKIEHIGRAERSRTGQVDSTGQWVHFGKPTEFRMQQTLFGPANLASLAVAMQEMGEIQLFVKECEERNAMQ